MTSRFRSLAIAGREAVSFARHAWLLRHDTSPVLPSAIEDGDDVAVFLHGLFATAGVLRPLRAAVTAYPRVHSASLSYPPGPGVPEMSGRLGALVAELPKAARLHLVGHSLGGIVARHYAIQSGDKRVVQTISIGTPFGGISGTRSWGIETLRDLHPQSEVIRGILTSNGHSGVDHLSIVSTDDTVVPAPLSHALPGYEVKVFRGLGHNTMLYDAAVAELVAKRILARRFPAA